MITHETDALLVLYLFVRSFMDFDISNLRDEDLISRLYSHVESRERNALSPSSVRANEKK